MDVEKRLTVHDKGTLRYLCQLYLMPRGRVHTADTGRVGVWCIGMWFRDAQHTIVSVGYRMSRYIRSHTVCRILHGDG